jgi:hypothetical protein
MQILWGRLGTGIFELPSILGVILHPLVYKEQKYGSVTTFCMSHEFPGWLTHISSVPYTRVDAIIGYEEKVGRLARN